jgi:O-antigen/teichoic acid export membrane protein
VRRVIAYSFAVEAVASITLIATFKYAGDLWGVIGFGAWTLARRIVAFVLPFTTLGVDIALPRYIAYEGEASASGYLAGASMLLGIGIGMTTLLLFGAPDFFSHVLFGDSSLRRFLGPLWGLLIAYSVHILYFATLRGRLRILEANLLHLWAFGVAPLVAFAWGDQSPELAMAVNAVLVALPPVPLLLLLFRRMRVQLAQASKLARTLVSYGVSRMATALVLTTLALLPTVIAAQQGGLRRVGAIALGITLIGFTSTLMAPIALISLPAAARQLGAGDTVRLARWYGVTVRLSLPIVLGAAVAAWICAPVLADIFLAAEAVFATQVLRVAGVGAGALAVFSLMRPLLDAMTEKPRVFQATLTGGAVFGAVWLAALIAGRQDHPLLPIIGYSAAMLSLALWSCVFAYLQLRHLRDGPSTALATDDMK